MVIILSAGAGPLPGQEPRFCLRAVTATTLKTKEKTIESSWGHPRMRQKDKADVGKERRFHGPQRAIYEVG